MTSLTLFRTVQSTSQLEEHGATIPFVKFLCILHMETKQVTQMFRLFHSKGCLTSLSSDSEDQLKLYSLELE
jgi:hypothetical protein